MTGTLATTTSGDVRGSRCDGGVVFRGVPFAAPPVGASRFRPPRPPEPWEGVRDCERPGPACPQVLASGGVTQVFDPTGPQSEDCLYLDIWTPAVDGARRPTMVWLHGGGFRSGSGSCALYAGDAFVRDGIVLVSLNYRLHAFGFLYLDELFDGALGTGNLGLLDQAAALAWVHDNISSFGGDPGNVTVFGESAGAMSIGALLAMGAPSFQRAILQSGAGHHTVSARGAGRVARRILELLGVGAGDWEGLLAVPEAAITKAAAGVAREAGDLLAEEFSAAMPFQPVVDDEVLKARPITLVAAGAAAGVDVVCGTCADELRVVAWGMPEDVQRRHLDPAVPRVLGSADVSTASVTRAYGSTRPGATELDLHLAMETDYRYTVPAAVLAEQQGRHARAWVYRFSWPTPVAGGELRACHGVDVPFVFETFGAGRPIAGDDPPRALAAAVHGAWARFATGGEPGWPAYGGGARPVMDFRLSPAVVDDPGHDERELWHDIVASWC